MRNFLPVSIMLVAAATLQAAGYCSLKVKVQGPSGNAVDTRVVIEEEHGWKAEKATRHGQVEFCGLGINPVTVTVGSVGCNQVVVHNVPLGWNETTTLPVLYDRESCQGETLPVAACAFLLRFADANHGPIAASFKAEKPFPNSHNGDEYGRIFIRIAAGQELSGTASAPGYKPTPVSIPCVSKNQRLDQVVVLEKPGQ